MEAQSWMPNGHFLVLKRCHKGIENRNELMITIPIWIRFPILKLHLWSPRLLSRVASYMGRPLLMDAQTRNQEKLEFARVCVEVEVGQDLADEIAVELMVSRNSLESSSIGSRQYALAASCLDILIPYVLQKKWQEMGKEKISNICDTSDAAGLQSLQIYQGLSDMEVVQAQGTLLNSAIAHKGINLEIVINPQGLELPPAPLIEDSLIMSDVHQKASNAVILTNQYEALNHVEELVIEEGPRVSILADSTVHGKAMMEERIETEGNAEYNRAVNMVDMQRSKNKADKRLSITHAGLKEKLRAASKQPLPAILAVVSKEWEAKMALIQQEVATAAKKKKQRKNTGISLEDPSVQ